MATQMMNLSVLPRGTPLRNLQTELTLSKGAPSFEIYQQLAAKTGTSINRIRVTKGSDGQLIPNSKDVLVHQNGLLDGSKIYVKDLGPQIAWATVFLAEYVGPILIHPLVYVLRPYIYRKPSVLSSFPPPSTLQKVALVLVLAHYCKREFETVFVHRFSNATMPARNIFKNCFHYWVICGLFLAYFIYSPTAPTAGAISPLLTFPGLAMFAIGELGNLNSHLVLRGLRSSGGKERGIPQGLGFDLVTCPNYMFETMAWTGFALVTRSWATVVFLIISVVQMAVWAKQKERRYRREFGNKYKKKRYTILPGIY